MRPSAHLEVIPRGERGAFREKRLGLHPELFTVFLATGANGAHNHMELMTELLRYADHCQVIVICGRDKETYNRLVHWRATHPSLRCFVEGFSHSVDLLIQVSDTIVTRGGTTTCANALHFKCPILFNAFEGIMPQERLTWKFFERGAGCEKIESAAEFSAILGRWLRDPESYRRAFDRFVQLRYEEDPTILIDEIVALANQSAGARLHRHPFFPSTAA
jgi:processive 1,2-diacylglycerol beta-glucosyltransferase